MRVHALVVSSMLAAVALPAFADEEPPATTPVRFEAEPLRDGAIIGISVGFAGVLGLIDSTGEVHPQQVTPRFDTGKLLWIDRGAITQSIDSSAGTYSNAALFGALAFAVADPIMTGVREANARAALVDAVIYAESLTITTGLTNLAKISVRRPRPSAYIEARQHADDPGWMNTDTNSSASFFSGHASTCAAITATSTYLAFARAPRTARPWITLAIGLALTTFTSYERVRAGAHFPTDVIAGALAGGGVGILVTHFHRADRERLRSYWLGYAPELGGQGTGGVLSFGGRF